MRLAMRVVEGDSSAKNPRAGAPTELDHGLAARRSES